MKWQEKVLLLAQTFKILYRLHQAETVDEQERQQGRTQDFGGGIVVAKDTVWEVCGEIFQNHAH